MIPEKIISGLVLQVLLGTVLPIALLVVSFALVAYFKGSKKKLDSRRLGLVLSPVVLAIVLYITTHP